MAGFMARLDEINALADRSPGFVWRLQGDSGNNTDYKVDGGDPLFIVNLSVWASLEDLHAFTYRSDHRTVFARRYEWFERRDGPNTVIWWQPAGEIPGTVEALRRLHVLDGQGSDARGVHLQAGVPAARADARAADQVAARRQPPAMIRSLKSPRRRVLEDELLAAVGQDLALDHDLAVVASRATSRSAASRRRATRTARPAPRPGSPPSGSRRP